MKRLRSSLCPASAWRLSVYLCWLFAGTIRAVDPNDVLPLLDEATLTHLEQTLDHFEARAKTDAELKKDFRFLDFKEKIPGDSEQAFSIEIAKRHPKFAAFAADEKWTPGTLYVTYFTCWIVVVANTDSETVAAPDDDGKLSQNLRFYAAHRARVDALFMRVRKVLD